MRDSLTTAADVRELLDVLAGVGVEPWIDGGWGVDALLGRQTREHRDVDVVIEDRDEPAMRQTLTHQGFTEVPMPYSTAVHSVWQHEDGREVDLHVVEMTGDGGVFGDEGVYPAAGFRGRGVIDGRPVRCITAEIQMEFHRGYELRAHDYQDMWLLHTELNVALPPEFPGERETPTRG